MDYRYWLELQTPKQHYRRVARLMGLTVPRQARQLLKVPNEPYAADLPPCLAVQHLLDRFDEKRSSLAYLEVVPEQMALWARLTDGPMRLDPVLLGQLGSEGIKLCLTDETNLWTQQSGPVQYLPAGIEGIWMDREINGEAPFSVGLSDGSTWEGRLVTFDRAQQDMDGAEGQFPSLTYPHSVLVPWIHPEGAHTAIVELLRSKTLEKVLDPLEIDSIQPELPHTQFEINVLHETGKALSAVSAIFGAQAASVRQSQQSLRISCPDHQDRAGIDTLHQIIDMVDRGAPVLQKEGIKRQDISITWTYVYPPRLRQELGPDLMYRLSQMGLTLEMNWRPAATQKVRYLA